MKFKFSKTLFIALTVLLLSACGGGGGSGADQPLTIKLGNLDEVVLSGSYDAEIKLGGGESEIQKVRLVRLELFDSAENLVDQMEVGYFDGAITGTLSTLDTTIYLNGDYTILLTALDEAGDVLAEWSLDVEIDNTPAADTTPPTISSFMLGNSTVVKDTPVTITVTATDDVGVTVVDVWVNDALVGAMAESGAAGNYIYSLATPAAGTFDVKVRAADAAGNETYSVAKILTVQEPSIQDTTPPTVGNLVLSQTTVTVGTPVTITVTATDDVGVTSVNLLQGGVQVGSFSLSAGNTYTYTLSTPNAGTFSLQAEARDAADNTGFSVPVTLVVEAAVVPDTTPPVVGPLSLSASKVTQGTSVVVTVNATDNIGVVGVDLHVNGSKVSAMAASGNNNYTYTLSTPQAGIFNLQAWARDAAGNVKASDSAVLEVEEPVVPDTTPPEVGPLSADKTNVDKGTSIALSVTATDNVGVVAVELLVNGTKAGQFSQVGSSSTYTYTYNTPNAGNFALQVVARDAAGLVNYSNTVNVKVNDVSNDTTPPTIGAISLSETAVTVGTPVTVAVTASDDVGVARVELYTDGALKGTFTSSGGNNYTYTLTTPVAGSFLLQARAYDDAGNVAMSSSETLTVNAAVEEDVTPPTLGALTLSANSVTEGTPVTVTVTAADDVGVVAVELYVDGQMSGAFTFMGDVNYSYTLNTPTEGTFLLQARARDAAGNVGMSNGQTLTVTKQDTEDTTPPVLSALSLSESNVEVGTPVTVTVTATDDVGVAAVEIYVDGQMSGAFTSIGGDNYSYTLTTPFSGTFQIQARARDAAGNTGLSNTLSLTVKEKDASDTEAPVVSAINLSTNPPIKPGTSVTITVTATDNVGVTAVELYLDGAKKADMTKAGDTYSYSWNTAGLDGNYQLQAKARDAAGNIGESPIRVALVKAESSSWVSPPAFPFAQVQSFGDNPGQLKMFMYVPADMPENAPLVMAMHGCNQNGKALMGNPGETGNPTGHANAFKNDSEWHKLADRYKFYVIFPEQTVRVTNPNDANKNNNDYGCFNWAGFYGHNFGRDQGESKSLMSMIDHIRNDSKYSIDNNRIFVTGLSAGGAMAVAMGAHYPDVFAGVAPMAGIVYGCPVWEGQTGIVVKNNSFNCMGVDSGFNFKGMPANLQRTADAWKTIAKARGPQNYTGDYPTMMIWQGNQDKYVDYKNMGELVKQWTALHGIDQTPDNAGSRLKEGHTTHTYAEYHDSTGTPKVATITLTGMDHGISVDTNGSGEDAGGARTSGVIPFAYWAHNTGIYSSYYAAKFWGLDQGAGSSSNVKVTITSPAKNAVLSENSVVEIKATATEDELGISYVEFYADGELLCTEMSAPYSCSWNTASIASGSKVTLRVLAFSEVTYDQGSQSIDVWVGEKGFDCVDYSGSMYQHRTATPPRATVVGTCNILTPECTYTLTGSNEEVKLPGSEAASTPIPLKETSEGYFERGTCN